MNQMIFASAHEIANAIRNREISSREMVEAYLTRIAQYNPVLKAIVTLDEDGARKRAQLADEALARDELWGPLHGVPITLEDAHPTQGLRSTWGGYPPLADFRPVEDGTVAARLKSAGAVLLGKTHGPMIWGTQSIFDQTNNPWNLERTPGGSSAGPAAALAAGLTALDIGLDTLGSIQDPAHNCGIFGMRPTEHRVPMTGIFFIDDYKRKFRIMSVAGPMARSLEDLRLALSVIAGADLKDTHVPPVPWRTIARSKLSELRIAWTSAFPDVPIAPAIDAAIHALVNELAQNGAKVEQRLPEIHFIEQSRLCQKLFDIIAGAALSPQPEGMPMGSIDEYFQLLIERDEYILAWEQFFTEWDVFLCSVGLITAMRRSEKGLDPVGLTIAEDQRNLLDIPYSLSPASGCPTIVIPLGQDADGMPFGLQLMSKRWNDEKLLAIAEVISEIAGGFQKPPGYD